MIKEFIKSLILIFIAEMGDKSQILAMAFAVQYKIKEVLLGVLLGTLLNHGLAVILGACLSNIMPIDIIQILSGFLFIGFALWTLKIDEEDEEEKVNKNLGPILTVALAFFIGELGDKTQIAAITLACDAKFPVCILIGTVGGMVLTSGIGILIGSKIGSRIPEFAMKLASASIFMVFGIVKLYTTVPEKYMTNINISIFLTLLISIVYLILRPTLRLRKDHINTALKEAALAIYEYTHQIKACIGIICLGRKTCSQCQNKSCIIAYTKQIIDDVIQNRMNNDRRNFKEFSKSLNRGFSREQIIDSLSMIIACLVNDKDDRSAKSIAIKKARRILEHILFYQTIRYDGNKERYYERIRRKDYSLAVKIINRVESLID